MITIEYFLEVAIYHKGVVGSWQEVPSLHFPLWMARNIPKEVTYNVMYMRHSQESMKEEYLNVENIEELDNQSRE